jgi:hypothetical protein
MIQKKNDVYNIGEKNWSFIGDFVTLVQVDSNMYRKPQVHHLIEHGKAKLEQRSAQWKVDYLSRNMN